MMTVEEIAAWRRFGAQMRRVGRQMKRSSVVMRAAQQERDVKRWQAAHGRKHPSSGTRP